jgi:hypothetical protein
MARGTTACEPVPWQLRRCLAASTLTRVRRFGACVGLLQASLGLLQLAFESVCENVFACIFPGDNRSTLAVLSQIHLPMHDDGVLRRPHVWIRCNARLMLAVAW